MKTDKTPTKSELTRQSLMTAAEKLFAKHGVENVTLRSIVEASGQKNESALQYHFKNRQGLINAINHARQNQIDVERGKQLDSLLEKNANPSLRDICSVLFISVFMLAKSDSAFRQWLKASSLDYARSSSSEVKRNWSNLGENTQKTASLLRAHLKHIDKTIFDLRLLNVDRLIAVSLSIQAKDKYAFHGPNADLFREVFLDGIVATFSAENSSETQQVLANQAQN